MTNEQLEYVWTAPAYDTSSTPSLISTTKIPHDSEYPENFIRSAKWCPDGSCVLSQCENRSFRLFDLPPELFEMTTSVIPQTLKVGQLIPQPSAILDFTWYPRASPRDPASYCFVASVRDCPVKLLDGTDGRLRASYRIVDHRERYIAPHSVVFNLGADKLYCGFEDAIEIFEVNHPGEGERLHTRPNKTSRDGLRGIISSLAFSPSQDYYAAGSLTPSSVTSPNIALFDESEARRPLMFLGADNLRAGVTQLQFNPVKPHLLYASFRRLDGIYCWDLRGDTGSPLKIFNRGLPVTGVDVTPGENVKYEPTNQRLRFDVDLAGKWLAVGDQIGRTSLFNLDAEDTDVDAVYSEIAEVGPTLRFRAGGDSIGSVGFHPLKPWLLSVSGSRHFEGIADDSDSSDSSSSDEESENGASVDAAVLGEPPQTTPLPRNRRAPEPVTWDASLKLWDFCEKSIGST